MNLLNIERPKGATGQEESKKSSQRSFITSGEDPKDDGEEGKRASKN